MACRRRQAPWRLRRAARCPAPVPSSLLCCLTVGSPVRLQACGELGHRAPALRHLGAEVLALRGMGRRWSAAHSTPRPTSQPLGQSPAAVLAPHHSRAPPPSRPPLQPRRPWLAGVPSGASWHRHPPPLEPWAGEVRPPPGRRCHRLGGRGSALAPVAIEEAVIRGWKGGPPCFNLQQHVQEMGEAMAPSLQRRQPFSHGS